MAGKPESTAREWGEWDRLQRNDHDTLIRLETIVKQIADDVKEVKDGTAFRLAAIEGRVSKLEQLAEHYDPAPLVAELRANTIFRQNFQNSWKTLLTVSSILGGVVGTVGTIIAFLTKFFGLTK